MIWFFRVLLVLFAVFGLLLLSRGRGLRRLTPELLSTWTPTTGAVVESLRRKDLSDATRVPPRWFHKLSYADPSGRSHEVWTETGLDHELPLGTLLPLRFNPQDPGEATTLEAGDGGGRAPGCALLAVGVLFVVVGVYGLVLTLR